MYGARRTTRSIRPLAVVPELILRRAGRAVEDTALSGPRPAGRVSLATRPAGKGPVRSWRSRVYDEPGVPPVHVTVVYHKEADSLPQCRFGTTSGRLGMYSPVIRGREPIGALAIGARATVRSTTAAVTGACCGELASWSPLPVHRLWGGWGVRIYYFI